MGRPRRGWLQRVNGTDRSAGSETLAPQQITEGERAPAEHRSVVLGLAPLSFSAALALPAYGVAAHADVLLPTYFVVVSFLFYFAALNAQAHKHLRWHDQLISAITDTATWCLFLAVASMVLLLRPPVAYIVLVLVLAFLAWIADLGMKLFSWSSFFRGRERHEPGQGNP